MKDRYLVQNQLAQQGLLPLYFNPDPLISVSVLRALYDAGVKILEYTNRGEQAFENYIQLLKIRDQEMPDLILGVGTIKSLSVAQKYLDAGADFLVSPNMDVDSVRYCSVHRIFHIPGCMTPTEIAAAEDLGASFIKLFPGNLLGPEFLTSIRDIFSRLHFMPTGGVDPTVDGVASWFNAGASAVGMGSRLVSKKLMEEKNYAALTRNTKQLLEIISAFRKAA